MFGQLLESRASGQRRSGGAALSVATHIAIIGAVTVATASGNSAPRAPDRPIMIRVAPPPPAVKPRPAAPRDVSVAHPALRAPDVEVVPVIEVPSVVPKGLPPIDLSTGAAFDSIVIGAAGTGRAGHHATTIDLGDDAPSSGEWTGNELMMRIVSAAKPRYPESLRRAGIDGHVLVRFTVDTLGAVDMSSVEVIRSTHDLFTRAVRDALPALRFKPAESHGRRVASLAEMPFEFSISR